jgi:moderate conductance mechanosensitive channel
MEIYSFILSNLGKIGASIGILAAAIITRAIISKSIRIAFSKVKIKINGKRLAKTNTIRSIFVNTINTIIIIIALLTIISTWGVNVAPILAGIGVLGIAISFGSQTLVKDLISGFFIIIEDQFNVEDRIKVGNFEGIVKRMTMRSTVIKDDEGNRVYIPNSKIDIVTRMKTKKSKDRVEPKV